MFVNNDKVKATPMIEGVKRKNLGRGGSLMMVEVSFDKDTSVPKHTHPHEQVSYIAKGSFEFTVAGEKRIVKAGDSVYLGSNVEHGVTSLEQDSKVVDVFTPQREDFLE